MTGKIVRDSAASIRAKLLAYAKHRGDDFGRVLTRYAIERLLFRLSQTERADHYVLKGAMLFVTWPQHVFRSTGDVDLLGQGDPDPAAIAVREANLAVANEIDHQHFAKHMQQRMSELEPA